MAVADESKRSLQTTSIVATIIIIVIYYILTAILPKIASFFQSWSQQSQVLATLERKLQNEPTPPTIDEPLSSVAAVETQKLPKKPTVVLQPKQKSTQLTENVQQQQQQQQRDNLKLESASTSASASTSTRTNGKSGVTKQNTRSIYLPVVETRQGLMSRQDAEYEEALRKDEQKNQLEQEKLRKRQLREQLKEEREQQKLLERALALSRVSNEPPSTETNKNIITILFKFNSSSDNGSKGKLTRRFEITTTTVDDMIDFVESQTIVPVPWNVSVQLSVPYPSQLLQRQTPSAAEPRKTLAEIGIDKSCVLNVLFLADDNDKMDDHDEK